MYICGETCDERCHSSVKGIPLYLKWYIGHKWSDNLKPVDGSKDSVTSHICYNSFCSPSFEAVAVSSSCLKVQTAVPYYILGQVYPPTFHHFSCRLKITNVSKRELGILLFSHSKRHIFILWLSLCIMELFRCLAVVKVHDYPS